MVVSDSHRVVIESARGAYLPFFELSDGLPDLVTLVRPNGEVLVRDRGYECIGYQPLRATKEASSIHGSETLFLRSLLLSR